MVWYVIEDDAWALAPHITTREAAEHDLVTLNLDWDTEHTIDDVPMIPLAEWVATHGVDRAKQIAVNDEELAAIAKATT